MERIGLERSCTIRWHQWSILAGTMALTFTASFIFRENGLAGGTSAQPVIILVCGMLITSLLIVMFLMLSRSSRRALRFADLATHELQSRNADLEQFIYTASHDLKSPLLTIRGFTGLIRRDIERNRFDRLDEFMTRIAVGADRMRDNVDDLLELTRIGHAPAEFQTVNLTSMLHDLLKHMEDQITASAATIRIQDDLPAVKCDPHRIKRVFENLLANALKYGRPDNRDFHISIGSAEGDGEIRLFVADNGPGVPPKYRKRIFGLFQRLKTDDDGTGVGLAIVSRVAEVHGGQAWVEDTPGGGATFVVALPRNPVPIMRRNAA